MLEKLKKLELVSDPDMYMFFEKGLIGGIPYISYRYRKATNKHLKSYDPKEESKYIIYLDVNNMVMQCLNFFQQMDSHG